MHQKVGRLTLAAALIILGAVLVVDNLLQTQLSWFLARIWPVLLILLGLEWIYAAGRLQSGSERVRTDGGAIALLVIVAIVAANVGAPRRSPFSIGAPHLEFSIASPPSPPSIPPIPGFSSASVPGEHRLTRLFEAGARELSLNAGAGSIEVVEGQQLQVDLHVTAYGRDRAEAEALAQRIELRAEVGSSVRLSPQIPAGLNRIDLRFTVTVPKGMALRLDTASGAISVQPREGDLSAQTSSGAIQVEQLTGNADLRSASGAITARTVTGHATATTSSGRILLERVTGDVRATSTSGAVTVIEPAGTVSSQASSGAVQLTASLIGGDYDLGSVSGRVLFQMPAGAGVTLDARSSSGTVSGPPWLTIGEGRNSGTGTQGDGAYQVKIRTSSGGISIEAR